MQQFMLEKFISSQPDMKLIAHFCDNGATGTNFERPDFERLMEKVQKKEINCIVVKDLSRFGRNYIETGYYLNKIFPELKVRFVAINDHYDTKEEKVNDEFMISLKNLVNDLYAKDISKKVQSAILLKQKKGEFIGSFAPYGYKKSLDNKNKLVIDSETAPIIRDIFQKKMEGLGNNKIARTLNEEKIPCPSLIRYQRGQRQKAPTGAGALWQGQMIKVITSNPTYMGHLAQGKNRRSLNEGIRAAAIKKNDWIIVKNTHEAIIDEKTFYKVQSLVKKNSTKSQAQYGRHPSTENIFKGLVVCADCKTKMIRRKSVSPMGTVRYTFICRVHAENLGAVCPRKCMGESELIESIFYSLRLQILLKINLKKLLQNLQNHPKLLTNQKVLTDKLTTIKQKIKRNNTLSASLYENFTQSLLTEQEYLFQKQNYMEQFDTLTIELKQIYQEESLYKKTITSQNEWVKAIKSGKRNKELTREMLLQLVHHITISDYNKIEIFWNFKDRVTAKL